MRSNQPRSARSLARPNNGSAMAAAIEIQPSTANRVGNLAGGAATDQRHAQHDSGADANVEARIPVHRARDQSDQSVRNHEPPHRQRDDHDTEQVNGGAACETLGACGLVQSSILLVNTHCPGSPTGCRLRRTGGTPRGGSRAVSTCSDRASGHRWVTDAGRAPRGVAGGALVMSPGVRAGRR